MFNEETALVEIPETAARKTHYKDIAVLALPSNGIVAKKDVIDLTGKMCQMAILIGLLLKASGSLQV